MTKTALIAGSSIYKEECSRFMQNLVKFAKECCGMETLKSFNRVDLKKAILNCTRGRSLTKFAQTLSTEDKRNLLSLSSMECPVICPSRKAIMPPVESMPSNIMKSSKKLRNFFGIPELQVCRGCVKKSRCRRYQQVERDVPDLSDLASVMIGVYSICKIHLDGSELVVPEFAFRELPAVGSVLASLEKYYKDYNIQTNIPRGDDQACARELERTRKEQELKKLQLLKEKVFNIPPGFNVIPKRTSYMTSFQRDLYNKLYKRKKPKEEEFIWVSDTADTTIPEEDSKLERINRAEVGVEASDAGATPQPRVCEKIEDLKIHDVAFRMEYSKPLGTEVDLVRYDVLNDRAVEGIRINAKGRFEIDLDSNVHSRGAKEPEHPGEGISMYRVPSRRKAEALSRFLDNLGTAPNDLSFLKRVPYGYGCQSSGEVLRPQHVLREEDMQNLEQIALALDSKNSDHA